MTLATHSIIAAALTKPIAHAHPALLFIMGIASHYLSDAIPHWDYTILSVENKEQSDERRIGSNRTLIVKDLIHFGADTTIGFGAALLLIWPETPQELLWTIIAPFGGMLPDYLQGIYAIKKFSFLKPVQKFHDIMHTKILLGAYPMIGIPFQLILFIAAALYLY